MIIQSSDLVNQARRLIAVAHLAAGGVKAPEDLRDECETYILLCRDRDPQYLAHLEAWINDRANDAQLDMFDDFEAHYDEARL